MTALHSCSAGDLVYGPLDWPVTWRLHIERGVGTTKVHSFLAGLFGHRQLLTHGAVLYGHLIAAYD